MGGITNISGGIEPITGLGFHRLTIWLFYLPQLTDKRLKNFTLSRLWNAVQIAALGLPNNFSILAFRARGNELPGRRIV